MCVKSNILQQFSVGSSEPTFTEEGLRQWKNATGAKGKLAKHSTSTMHDLSMDSMQRFKSSSTPIDMQLVGASQASIARKEKEGEENRGIVGVIFDVIRHLARQNSSFRGHDELGDSSNRGNFLEEIYFLAKYHQPLKRWKENHPENLSYFSPQTEKQNVQYHESFNNRYN